MAILQYKPANAQVFIGLSTDTKPTGTTTLTGPQAGDKFFETDTNKLFIYGGAAWTQISAATVTAVYGAL